ncbi:MAG: AEC family transporter [Mariprofundaceae bacterium]|nr:AEC family transporter [Mariprofundaceae bacterium]
MMPVLLTMAGVIALGSVWRWKLGETTANHIRKALTQSVYTLFLPALVLHMLWQSPVNINTLRIPALAGLCVMLALLSAWVMYRFLFPRLPAPSALGALLLASAFGNFTYLGLPVLTQVFGESSAIIAIQFDLLASTPLLFTVGILLATHYGEGKQGMAEAMHQMLRVPALWAASLGLLLSGFSIALPEALLGFLSLLGSAVIPLMLLAVGMALGWKNAWLTRMPVLIPVLLAQLLIMPAIAWGLCLWWQIPQELLPQIVIEAAMPSMVLGLVVCDRFKLDTSLYAEAITVSTFFSLFSLPLWWYCLG